ncbi:hypothetical protein D3C81_1302930 [compost metagenome]
MSELSTESGLAGASRPVEQQLQDNKLVTIEEQYEKAASGGDLLLCLKHNESLHELSIIWHRMVKRFTLLTNTGG